MSQIRTPTEEFEDMFVIVQMGTEQTGCCAHVATVIYYLAHARYKSKIIKPAEILTSMFDATGITTTIEENSDDD